jgi:hypothetical protein
MDDGPLETLSFSLWLYHPSYPEGASTRPIMAVLRARRRSRTSLKKGFALIASGCILNERLPHCDWRVPNIFPDASQNPAFGNQLGLISLTSITLALRNARSSVAQKAERTNSVSSNPSRIQWRVMLM